MRNWIVCLAVLCFLSCGNDNNNPNAPLPINVTGTVWKIVAAMSECITISQNPKKTVDNLYGDSASIAEKGSGFGSYNFLSFVTSDTVEIYSNIIPEQYKGAYTVHDSTISSVFATSDTTARHLIFTMDQNSQLLLDYPAVEVRYYAPSTGMAYSRTYDSIRERDDYISTLDSVYQASSLDSLVYSTVEYYYIKQ